MKILEQALDKIKTKNKKQRIFFLTLIYGLIGATGKRTFRNMSRYMQISEHTFARQMSKPFDFAELNTLMIKESKTENEELIAIQDASYIPKSGKSTDGIDYFWNGCAGKSEKGLETDVIGVAKINADKKEGYAISAQQTPENPIPKAERKQAKSTWPTRIDFYLSHLKTTISKLFELGIKYIAVDSLYAKSKYVNNVVELGLHVISKLRKDARFRHIYTGPQKSRGRKKKFDNRKVKPEDFETCAPIKIEKENVELRSLILHSVSLNIIVRVILVRKFSTKNKIADAILFSTDIELDPLKIYKYYVARFQIEFVFRDAKNFTGFTDCQSRNAQRLHYHFNASLVALNFAKLKDSEIQKKHSFSHAFSMANYTRQYHVNIVIDRIISMFDFDPTLIKSHPQFNNLVEFANVKH